MDAHIKRILKTLADGMSASGCIDAVRKNLGPDIESKVDTPEEFIPAIADFLKDVMHKNAPVFDPVKALEKERDIAYSGSYPGGPEKAKKFDGVPMKMLEEYYADALEKDRKSWEAHQADPVNTRYSIRYARFAALVLYLADMYLREENLERYYLCSFAPPHPFIEKYGRSPGYPMPVSH